MSSLQQDIEHQHEGSPLTGRNHQKAANDVTVSHTDRHLSFDGSREGKQYDHFDYASSMWHKNKRFLVVSGSILVALFLFRQAYDDTTTPSSTSIADLQKHVHKEPVSVAFIGNSMFYFNDFPRLMERISSHRYRMTQNSCLHGGASIASLVDEGNAMYPNFATPNAIIDYDKRHNVTIHDYGACTVQQLLLGWDDRLHDPGYAQPTSDLYNPSKQNPCRVDPPFLEYAIQHFGSPHKTNQQWDYVLMNDNTKNPARAATRALALQTLERFHVPWFLATNATPVFLWTHAYDNTHPVCVNMTSGLVEEPSPNINMTRDGLDDIANFTSLTRVGIQSYVDLLQLYLPKHQTPRIAPVGLAFLTIHEENYELWKTLFHCDHLHASPSGSFLQGMVVYHTLFGQMPDRDYVVTGRMNMASLWSHARMMQHAWEPSNPFPTKEVAEYLYDVAERVTVGGHIPKSYIHYQNGEVAYEQR